MESNSNKLNLKAVILVGGFGTRLRPLTFTKPKPLIELANQPTLIYQIEALVEVGVKEIVLAINYQPEKMVTFIEEIEKKFSGVKIHCSKEEVPLGTCGPISLARDNYFKDKFDYLFVFNADIICNYNLKKLLDFHIQKGGEGTICVTKVENPSRYGVILSDSNSRIDNFIEKPQKFISDEINAGLYCFSYSFLNRIETKSYSIEREVFPKMAEEKLLYKMNLDGFWLDIGTPKDFLEGCKAALCNLDLEKKGLGTYKSGNGFIGKVLVGSNCKIEEECEIGPNVVLGDNIVIKKGTKIKNSVLFSNVKVDSHTFIDNSLIGWSSRIGRWVSIKGGLLGEDVEIGDEMILKGNVILPNVTVKNKELSNNDIIMF